MEATERIKLARVVSNTTVHIFLLEIAIPEAGAAENEQGVNFYLDRHLSTYPE